MSTERSSRSAGESRIGLAGRLAKGFLRSKLTPLLVLASLMLGLLAVWLTPREEEPQIVVPMVDLYVPYPGASPKEVESQVTTPLERRLWGIPGVEYLYSMSRPGMALITVRFKVNEPQEPSLVKLHQELAAHPELLPAGAMKPIVKLQTIDDVPFLVLTLHGKDQTPGQLRKVAEVLGQELSTVPSTAQVKVLGGARRMVRVEPDPDRMRSLGFSLGELQPALQSAEAQLPAGALVDRGRRTEVEAAGFILQAAELNRLVVGVRNQRPIYLADVAKVVDGPDPEPPVTLFAGRGTQGFETAVSVTLSKRAGTNATALAEQVLAKVEALKGGLIPRDLTLTVTRNYGETAGDKSNELIEHLLIATLSVIALILLAMGWRSAVVVGIAVPVTLALTLLITYLFGYTLNRVTLFAIIFSIGILVDDAIVVVENIHRHMQMPGQRKSFAAMVVEAVDEVGNPTILATFAVIAAILPMAFVRGLMGPYMRPIPVGASLAMLFSLVIAFVISPWASLIVFKKEAHLPEVDDSGLHPATPENAAAEPVHDWPHKNPEVAPDSRMTALYRKVMHALLTRASVRWAFFGGVVALLLGAMSLVGFGVVKVKMLPFDNKSEFMVQLDLPAGTPREDALAVGQDLARRLLKEDTVKDVQVYAGEAAPFTFVGMVRHSFLRKEAEMVDLQVNLVPKGDRKEQSHAIVVRLRPELEKLAKPAGARMKLVEIPPGPPVMDTIVAEIYGPTDTERIRLSKEVLCAFQQVEGIVDVDSTLNATGPKISLVLDREKAALHGVAPTHVIQTLAMAGYGHQAGAFHVLRGSSQVPVVIQLASGKRQNLEQLLQLTVPGARGQVPVRELVAVKEGVEDSAIHHKNLMPVVYVFSDLAGAIESPVYALAALNKKIDAMKGTAGAAVPRLGLAHPENTESLSLKWDGEWHITLEVFRDLGMAFAAVLVLIFVLVVGWFESFEIPWVILVPIPLSLIGIIPAHGLMGAFFTATSMIGFIAGAGIIVRNSIILVDFIELKLKEGMSLEAAVEEAGVVRFRPMLLTASAVLVGSAVMLADPIFQGLAISLMAGEVAATLLSRMAVPVLYYLVARRGHAANLQRQAAVSLTEE
ncbi:efflux RND transporter permease subunit [Geothrix sp. PMB-07]|uniref:efflux RND transporter permease subunit n=1 Tax=Geothrix sp. PMB-07 TaxID=3068640 RepID=UPI002741B48B|nr:efflux RND transporter permease subunit [Geothrix sp. PMB-07]WLT32531.1 efflux RND transporter permease subunit [Geothrix sp. PMB-07]